MRKIQFSNTSMLLIVLLLVAITYEFGKYTFSTKFEPIPNILRFQDSCHTVSGKHTDKLVLAVQTERMAKSLLERLCNNKLVSQQFGEVEANWMPNERQMLVYVGKGQVDLVLIKDNFIHAFQSDVVYGYQQIASYKDYSAFFIALKEKPELNKEYLLGKKIGLLDYASSRSGHIAPMSLFKQLDIDKSQVQIVYAKSHMDLRNILENGSVDIISSYWSVEDEKRFLNEYKTPLMSSISGSKWYLREADKNTALKCAIQKELNELAALDTGYYSNINLINPCSGGENG